MYRIRNTDPDNRGIGVGTMGIRVLDLYCGMGGLSLGFALAIENAEILALDIDRDAVATYNYNLSRLGASAEIQDVLKWRPGGEFDIVMGGVPCQPYSLANTKRRGKDHPLYPTLPRFFDVVLELKPKVFLMENVKGLVTRTHRQLLEEQLERVKPYYNVKHQVLNAAYYGVPQRRERLFVLGIRKDLGVQPSFPAPTHGENEKSTLIGRVFRWVTVREAIGDLLSIPPSPQIVLTHEQVERIRREREDTSRHFARMEFPDSLDEPSRTISSHTVEGTKRETIVVPINLDTEYQRKHPPIGLDDPSRALTSHMSKTSRDALVPCLSPETVERILRSGVGLRTHDPDKPAMTVKGVSGGSQNTESYLAVGNCYRRLTVREALRLQSFPDWWDFPPGVSMSKQYRLVGEAVPPILAYRLAIHIGKLMEWKVREPPRFEEWNLPYFFRSFADYFTL